MNSTDNFDGFGGLRFYQKIHFKIIVLLLLVFAANYALNYYFEKISYKELETNIIEITSSSIGGVRDIVSSNLKSMSERYIKTLVEKIYFQQLDFLKERPELKGVKDARALIDFCAGSAEYQKLFENADSGLAKYSYVTVSIYDGPRLVLVSHNKKSIIGTDIFELVKKLSPADREKQQTEKFISRWVNRESGGIYYEQTATFKDSSIPAEYNKKYSYQHWGKFNGIDIVVEYTTYIDEFMKTVNLMEKRHAEIIDKVNGCTSCAFETNAANYLYFLLALTLVLGIISFSFIKSRFINPLRVIAAGLDRFGDGRLEEPIAGGTGGEFELIGAAANSMAKKLRETLHSLEETNAGLERKVNERTSELAEAAKLLEAEKEKSEALIKNILPEKIARRLMDNPGQTIAEEYAMATIIFTDFKGFTNLSESSTPQKLIRELNEVFAHFDGLCEKHGVEKIKTIGDAYMAVAGVPESSETNPADAVEAALAMRDYIAGRLADKNNLALEIRIGVHSGPVIAGVIGRRKMVYDIWGDSVNIASRMESNGAPGKVNISESTYKLLKNRYKCESRGSVEIKGKGSMAMYFVER